MNKKLISFIALALVFTFALSTLTVCAQPLFAYTNALLYEEDGSFDEEDFLEEAEEEDFFGEEEVVEEEDVTEEEDVIVIAPAPDTTKPAFEKTGTYGEIQPYNDVHADHWFYKSVANAYEYGLMFGKSKTVFGPNDTMTVAEAITIACRLNTTYYGLAPVTNSGSGMWYDNYVTFAIDNGIIADGDFTNYNVPVTRAEMARIFAKTLPAEWLDEINAIDAVPDMDKSNPDYAAVLALYKAGICSGSDAQHNYQPETNIKRSEVAAIITRLADKTLRVTF